MGGTLQKNPMTMRSHTSRRLSLRTQTRQRRSFLCSITRMVRSLSLIPLYCSLTFPQDVNWDGGGGYDGWDDNRSQVVVSRANERRPRATSGRSNSLAQSPSIRASKKRKTSETTALTTNTKTTGSAPAKNGATATKKTGNTTAAVPRQQASVAQVSRVRHRSLMTVIHDLITI
jgi:hypothetical protein